MKLYLTPGACSRAVHIALREAGLPFEIERVDLATHRTASDEDYYHINPKGYVPTLDLQDGNKLTEVAAVLQYVADQKPNLHLAPANGTWERYRLQELLNFLATEVHKSFGVMFNPAASEEEKERAREKLGKRLEYLSRNVLGDEPYLMGEDYTVADCYLFTVLGWAKPFGIDLERWPSLQRYLSTIDARPAVREALEAEQALAG